MRIERTKNATRNIFFGVILRMYQIIAPFLMRTAMIYFMGVQYLGLNSLFVSILQVLNLAELGVGSAMVFSMYKPIVEDDKETICALLFLYRKYYRNIGFVIAGIGIVLLPFVPRLISGDIPNNINIYVLYLLNLSATVLSYWLFAYKNSLLQAHQRLDVISKITLATSTIQYILQFLVLYIFRDYYLYVVVIVLIQIFTNIITAYIAGKFYPFYTPSGLLEEREIVKINQRIKDLFTSKIGSVIVNSADTLVISAFLGLAELAIYQNYYFILSSIISFVAVVFNAVMAGVGNSLIVESKEKNFRDLKVFTFIICWISGVCVCCFLNLYQPFMKVWVGKKLMLDYKMVICFSIYFYVFEINQLLNTYKDAGGIWHKDRYRPLVTAIVNLGLNLILVNVSGLYGVLLSTILSMVLVGMPWLFYNLFTVLFEYKYMKEYIITILGYVIVSVLASMGTMIACDCIRINGILNLIIRLVMCLLVSNVVFGVCYAKKEEFKNSMMLADRILGGKLMKLIKRFS